VCTPELPFFTVRPSAVYTVVPGRSISMPCVASGKPPPAIVWRKVRRMHESFRFYRAMRMHSADYALARCLSVPPSVCYTPVFCLNGYTYPQSFFSLSGSHTILVFPHLTGWEYSDRDPLTGASNARGYEKNHDFRPISLFISEMMQDRAIVIYGRRIGNRTQAFEWYQCE